MSGAVADPRLSPTRSAPKARMKLSWSDPKFRNIVWQVLIVGGLVAIVAYLVHNTNKNLEARHIATGFAFLARTAGIPIGEHVLPYDPSVNTYGDALLIGILNTLKVAVVGIVLTTILGTLIGIGRLSKNWLLARLAATYVEVLRDIPLLLQLLFWYTADADPAVRARCVQPDPRRVLLQPRPQGAVCSIGSQPHSWALAAFLVGLIGTIAYSSVASRKQAETGVRPRVWPAAVGLLIVLPAGRLGRPGRTVQRGHAGQGRLQLPRRRHDQPGIHGAHDRPDRLHLRLHRRDRALRHPGRAAGPVGGGGALGLRPGAVLRQIVLPQALRVVIPPMTSQFLNLTKNSSLAVAIGYQDVRVDRPDDAEPDGSGDRGHRAADGWSSW